MKATERIAKFHPVEGSKVFEVGDELPNGWYDSPADFEAVIEKHEPPAVNFTPMPSYDDEPAKKGGWPKGKARK